VAEFVCHGIRLTENSLDELDGDRPAVSIQRTDIIQVSLAYGVASERTVATASLGIAILAFFVLKVRSLFDWFTHGGLAYYEEFVLLLPGPLGGALLYLAFRRRYYLRVQLADGSARKLVFDKHATRRSIEAFLDESRHAWHCPVLSELAAA
jgi:hypothetical protein